MSKDTLERARDLIKQKRYSDARQILESVNHPTAIKWLAKLDEIELGDPFETTFAPKSKPKRTRSGLSLDDAIAVFAQQNWAILSQSPTVVQMEKKKGVNAWAGALLIVFLGVLGAILVAIGSASSSKAVATIRLDDTDNMSVHLNKQTKQLFNRSDLEAVAKSVRGMSVGTALLLGVVSWILWALFLNSF
jgi:hypothetical protein